MEENRVYDWREVASMLAEIAQEKPEGYCYPKREGGTCLYFYDGQPDCIIGHLLAKIGFTVEDVPQLCSITAICRDHGLPDAYNPLVASRFTTDAVRFMQAVQERQDDGVAWVDAVELTMAEWVRSHGLDS